MQRKVWLLLISALTLIIIFLSPNQTANLQSPLPSPTTTPSPSTTPAPSNTPTLTPIPLPTATPIVVIIATPPIQPPEPPFPQKYQTEIVVAILSLISGVLLTLVFPTLLRQAKKGLLWSYQKLHIEPRLRNHYCRNVSSDLRKLKILGMVKPRDLEQIFIGLRIKEYVQRDLLAKTQDDGERNIPTKPFDFQEALEGFSCIVILGDPGAGKTTLTRHATVLCAERKLKINGEEYLPIYIPLNELKPFLGDQDNRKREFEDFLSDILKSYGFPKAKDYIVAHLRDGRCLILLDGFDELANETYQENVAIKIRNLVRSYNNKNRIILTSRAEGFRGELFSHFVTLEITNLSFEQTESFIIRWFGGMSEKANRLVQILREDRRLALVVSNPLMLAVTCIAFEHNEDLPHRRVDLYERCIDTLVRLWDKSRGIDREAQFASEHKEKILQNIAFDFHNSHKTDFSKSELLASIRKHLPKVGEKQYQDVAFLEELLEHTGIVRQKTQDTFTFQHLTFQEYLTAQVLATDLEMGAAFILSHLADSWWSETIVLTAGILRDATDLIEPMYEYLQRNPSEDILLLLGRCLTDADLTNLDLKDDILTQIVLLAHPAEEVA